MKTYMRVPDEVSASIWFVIAVVVIVMVLHIHAPDEPVKKPVPVQTNTVAVTNN